MSVCLSVCHITFLSGYICSDTSYVCSDTDYIIGQKRLKLLMQLSWSFCVKGIPETNFDLGPMEQELGG